MKQLFRRFFEWLGWIKPKKISTPHETPNAPVQDPYAIEEDNVTQWETVSDPEDWTTETITNPPLPPNANKIQHLDKKYNNSKTIYRDSKGRYASLN
jgi:hypothetical protein